MTSNTDRAKLFVTGHRGLVGQALMRREGSNALKANRHELDLRDAAAVSQWFQAERPVRVIHAAGKVGGILANSREPASFLDENLMMGTNVLRAAWESGVEKLLMLGSSCIYPRECPQPIREDYLNTGPLEPTNQGYAIAKIACVMACDAYRAQHGCSFISAMPTNLYGPHDNFHPGDSHVIPGMMRRFHEAKLQGERTVVIWGSGEPCREFMHVDDLAEACLFLMEHYDEPGPINVGTGEEVSIRELAELLREIVHPDCELQFDRSKPDGTPRKLLDVSRIHGLGWKHRIELRDGIERTYEWFVENRDSIRQ